jgi:hypothetical protein
MALICFFSVAVFGEESPSIITNGLSAYEKSNINDGIEIWLKGSPLQNDDSTKKSIQEVMSKVEGAYGKIIGWEQIRLIKFSPSFERVYFLIKYEKGPLFATYDCYKPYNRWVISAVDFNTKLQTILPYAQPN